MLKINLMVPIWRSTARENWFTSIVSFEGFVYLLSIPNQLSLFLSLSLSLSLFIPLIPNADNGKLTIQPSKEH